MSICFDPEPRRKFDIWKFKKKEDSDTKKCTICQRRLHIDSFYDLKRGDKIYKRSNCKECESIQNVRLQRHRRKKAKL
jgi:hypothetical protein